MFTISGDSKSVAIIDWALVTFHVCSTKVGGSESKILKAPQDFVEEFLPKLTAEQKSASGTARKHAVCTLIVRVPYPVTVLAFLIWLETSAPEP